MHTWAGGGTGVCQATAGNGERPHDVPGQPSCWCVPHIAAAGATEKQPPASQGVRSRRTSVGGLLSVRRHTQDAPVSPRLQRRWAAVLGRRRTGRAMPAVHPACGGNCSMRVHVYPLHEHWQREREGALPAPGGWVYALPVFPR